MHARCRERRTCREAVCNPVIGEDLGGSSDLSVEIDTRLTRIRFPCEQHLDMGQSVLTPEEDLLGKVGEPVGIACVVCWTHSAVGEREFGPRFRNRLVGNVHGGNSVT